MIADQRSAAMFAVIFEVQPKPGRLEAYLDIAARLRPLLEAIDGFISVERFGSLTTEGKYVSLSFWRDEAAVIAWRRQAEHHLAQARGRDEIFADYRIRVAEVVRDYGMFARAEAPQVFPEKAKPAG
jgi:heme-degrading monooxygenase HmoA